MPLNRKFIAIVGPTAAGKTVMAIELAKEFSGEIICADSRTVYEGMDIGTAKPSKIQQKVVKHHLLDVITLDKPYSVAQFKKEAKQAMQDIRPLAHTDPLHMSTSGEVAGGGPDVDSFVHEVSGGTPSFDGNEVDLDTTMSAMAENAIQYGANARAASAKLAILKYVVSDGG